ncbi:MAG: M20/M25/M40 family metallo-hydrolase [bacterium]
MIQRTLVVVAALVSLSLAPSRQSAQVATPVGPKPIVQRDVGLPSNDNLVARMIQEGTQRSHVEADLSYLLDMIGPRLSGSPEMRRANEWTQQKFREYGADRSELEGWTFGVGWTRGPMTLRMLAPQRRELLGVSWAWSPGTNGALAGDVVYVDSRTRQDYDRRFAGKLRGTWVMIGPAAAIPNPDGPAITGADSLRLDAMRRTQLPQNDEERAFMPARAQLLVREGIAGLIHDGAKEFGLFTMAGSPAAVSPFPQLVISNENYAQFQRLAQRAERVRIEADIKNTFTSGDIQQYNTVADIRGTEKPDEVVMLGAHLDSWDIATGGTDNGAGAIAVLEAARILKASGVRPRRTIRFVLFGGEEEGLFGSQAYTEDHRAELDKIQALLVIDNGTGHITGMTLQGREELRDMWKSMLSPLVPLGQLLVKSGNKTGTDHLAFLPYGVPGFNYDQATVGYNHTHHSQVDDFNHTVPADVAQAATIMAVNAWQLADMKELLARGPKSR